MKVAWSQNVDFGPIAIKKGAKSRPEQKNFFWDWATFRRIKIRRAEELRKKNKLKVEKWSVKNTL